MDKNRGPFVLFVVPTTGSRHRRTPPILTTHSGLPLLCNQVEGSDLKDRWVWVKSVVLWSSLLLFMSEVKSCQRRQSYNVYNWTNWVLSRSSFCNNNSKIIRVRVSPSVSMIHRPDLKFGVFKPSLRYENWWSISRSDLSLCIRRPVWVKCPLKLDHNTFIYKLCLTLLSNSRHYPLPNLFSYKVVERFILRCQLT